MMSQLLEVNRLPRSTVFFAVLFDRVHVLIHKLADHLENHRRDEACKHVVGPGIHLHVHVNFFTTGLDAEHGVPDGTSRIGYHSHVLVIDKFRYL